ncbi:cytosine/adenosine deaminase-related metal-dependent hydrolase [Luteibacter rhizovicinus]|uniref:Cytosine/adenosine deaminase-related metal-dependent hydrolase n=1 Tax=Luteibacter rhizovicinus TaxID=242606 RepID=A0A4R3YYS4_9GAMM|nr:amidohydrolase family protein [Luteibacter rhizovicinus]TCV97810.1 cytosine/adenosine deaminase-related metal-dependent hydrolase [Luteibacter rhizovicinus]
MEIFRHHFSSDTDLVGAVSLVPDGVSHAPLPVRAGRIDASPGAHAYPVDLRDHLIFPGLINAHDHLHVNGVPPLRHATPFPNSYAWISAFQSHFQDPIVVAALDVPKSLRLRHGALKNLLAGTTCVAHHDPWHPALDDADFPVALLRDYGWSYTLAGPDYGPPVRQSFAATPAGRPWLIHLAEGTDETAQAELAQLDALGCLAANTVLIHGVGLRETDIDRVIACGAAVVWCPQSNRALLGRTLDPRRLCEAGRLTMGSDSRLSGARDLLDELSMAAARDELDATSLLALVTTRAARILRLAGYGSLAVGAPADMAIVEDRGGDPADSLVGLRRSQLRAVVRDGLPRIADPDFADWFAATGVDAVAVMLDGKPKLLARSLADPALLALEPGLAFVTDATTAARRIPC